MRSMLKQGIAWVKFTWMPIISRRIPSHVIFKSMYCGAIFWKSIEGDAWDWRILSFKYAGLIFSFLQISWIEWTWVRRIIASHSSLGNFYRVVDSLRRHSEVERTSSSEFIWEFIVDYLLDLNFQGKSLTFVIYLLSTPTARTRYNRHSARISETASCAN